MIQREASPGVLCWGHHTKYLQLQVNCKTGKEMWAAGRMPRLTYCCREIKPVRERLSSTPALYSHRVNKKKIRAKSEGCGHSEKGEWENMTTLLAQRCSGTSCNWRTTKSCYKWAQSSPIPLPLPYTFLYTRTHITGGRWQHLDTTNTGHTLIL